MLKSVKICTMSLVAKTQKEFVYTQYNNKMDIAIDSEIVIV